MARKAVALYLFAASSSLLAGIMLLKLDLFSPTSPAAFPIHFYQQMISGLDGRDCPSYPTCSAYSKQAFIKHGLLMGSWLTLDRLIHESDDLFRGPWVLVGNNKKLYDPLSRNDFWIIRSEENEQ